MFLSDICREKHTNIQHYLNEQLIIGDRHIGAGICPSERGKGLGTKMLALAIEECYELGIERILVCCDKNKVEDMWRIK